MISSLSTQSSNTLSDKLGEVVREAMERFRVPGAAVGIIHINEIFTSGFGITNINHPLPVNDETLFQIASISKTFVATVTMRLVEQGKLDLDTPMRTYLPELKLSDSEATEKATLRHVFTHYGGWVGDYFGDFGRGDDALAKNVAEMVNLPQTAPLGQLFSYNNSGYAIAGRIIEVITGKTFEEAVKNLILAPLGMDHTFYFAEDAIVHRVAVGHEVFYDELKPTEVVQPWALSRASAALGGLITNIRDLLTYAKFQLGDGSWKNRDGETIRLLSPETMKTMHSRQAQADSLADEVGLAWMLYKAGEVKVVGHSGGSSGQTSILQLVPDQKFAIAVVTNANIGNNLCNEVVKWVLENYLGVPDEPAKNMEMSIEEMIAYVGVYEAVLSRAEVEVKDGILSLQEISKEEFQVPNSPPTLLPPATRLAFFGPDQIVGINFPSKGARGEFIRGVDGSVEWLRFGGRLHKRL